MFVCLCLSLNPLPPPFWINKQQEGKGTKISENKTKKKKVFSLLFFVFILFYFQPLLALVRSLWDLLHSHHEKRKAKWRPIACFLLLCIFNIYILLVDCVYIFIQCDLFTLCFIFLYQIYSDSLRRSSDFTSLASNCHISPNFSEFTR